MQQRVLAQRDFWTMLLCSLPQAVIKAHTGFQTQAHTCDLQDLSSECSVEVSLQLPRHVESAWETAPLFRSDTAMP